jgi:hypothetical protein
MNLKIGRRRENANPHASEGKQCADGSVQQVLRTLLLGLGLVLAGWGVGLSAAGLNYFVFRISSADSWGMGLAVSQTAGATPSPIPSNPSTTASIGFPIISLVTGT